MAEQLPIFRVRTAESATLLLMAALLGQGCAPVRYTLFDVETPSPTAPATHAVAGTPAAAPGGAGDLAAAGGGAAGARDGAGRSGSVSDASTASNLNPFADFGWTETIPGAGACQAATFSGNFSCVIDSLLSDEQLEGSLSLKFKGSTEAQLLTIGGGQLIAFDDYMKLVLSAPVTGSLDCNTQQLSADIQPTMSEVMPADRQIAWINLTPQPVTSGTLKGSLDPRVQSISGDLTLVFEPSPDCIGTFTVRASP